MRKGIEREPVVALSCFKLTSFSLMNTYHHVVSHSQYRRVIQCEPWHRASFFILNKNKVVKVKNQNHSGTLVEATHRRWYLTQTKDE